MNKVYGIGDGELITYCLYDSLPIFHYSNFKGVRMQGNLLNILGKAAFMRRKSLKVVLFLGCFGTFGVLGMLIM